jgi:FkbM family methyltransferase
MKRDSMIFRFLEYYGTHFNHRGKWWVHSRLRKFLGADINEEIEISREGLRWVLSPGDHVQADLFWYGSKDMWDVYHLKSFLKPRSTLFDIGANFGYYSLTMARILGKDCQIFAFEPTPSIFDRFRKHISINFMEDVIHAHGIGLSNVEKEEKICVVEENTGASYIEPGATKGVDISLSTLDGFCSKNNVGKIDFIKIDTEGFETFVLEGGKATIAKDKPVILIELNPSCLIRAGSSLQDVVGFFKSHDYGLYHAKRDKLLPLLDLPHEGDYANAFCIPNSLRIEA